MVSGVSLGASFGLVPLRAGGTARAPGEGAPGDGAADAASGQPTPEAQQRIQELRRIDASVRQHEAAHQAAGGPHAGGASFTYTRGPDGKSYAVAGEVPIDVGAEGEPEATVRKMDTVKAAALAPSSPSPQDLRVAQQADSQKAQAQQELRRQAVEGPEGGDGGRGGAVAPALAARGAAAYGAALGLGRPSPAVGIVA